ncbi:protein kinase [Streptomyces sp. NPDC048483]|uniref:protein kinase domain-containing protein n=1 Tax=Streptomyces sp. NPDC048483 TaxID=3154927 RepID=UPI0034474B22
MLTADRYRLLEVLGRGGMGEVWRAEDTRLGREVAVKLLLDTTVVPDAVERFRQEARTAAGLNHPHVLAVHDFGEDRDRCYLVMELVHGRSLRAELTERGALDIDEACRIAGQAAAGLAAAHRAGVVHRDIKPGNLLLGEDGLKVADFGIARATGPAACALTTTGQILGTLAYLAPERARGRPAGPTTDVYALGCVLYEMLCGRPPFTTDDVPAVVAYQHIDADPVPPRQRRAEVPVAVGTLVLQMLAKDPAARPTAAEVAERLGVAARAGDPPSPAGRPSAEPATADATRALGRPCRTRPVRRTAVLAGVAAAALCAASTAVGYALLPLADGTAGAPPRTTASATPARQSAPPAPRRTADPQPVTPTEQQHNWHPAAVTPLPRGEAAKKAPGAQKRAGQEAGKAGGAGHRRHERERKTTSEESRKRRGAAATPDR